MDCELGQFINQMAWLLNGLQPNIFDGVSTIVSAIQHY